jgi:aspartokinase-like uncharacterized kinase
LTDPCDNELVSVIKVGGSLLSLPDLSARILRLLDRCRISNPLLIIGGGDEADRVRSAQQEQSLTDSQAHWQAIHAMSVNARHFEKAGSTFAVAGTREAVRSLRQSGHIPILDSEQFLRFEQPLLTDDPAQPVWCRPLPESWSVTSDSIAAWTAARWPASELWLLKSCTVTQKWGTQKRGQEPIARSPERCSALLVPDSFDDPSDLRELSAAGLVDEFFHQFASAAFHCHWINLRTEVQ